KLVGPAENAPDVAQRHIGRIIGVGTGRTMGQDFPQLPPKSLLMQKVRPHHHAAMGGQPLIGKRNPNGRSVIFGVNWQAHRLVRLPSRFGNLIWFHHHKPAKRCSLFQAESFRLSIGSQCVVSNGATLAVTSSILPTKVVGIFTIATVTGAGSVWTNAGDFDFGQYSNVLSVTSGGKLVDDDGYIEYGVGATNTIIVAGTNSLWNNLGDLHIADIGDQLLITNGGIVADNNGYFGDNAGNSNCFVLVSGPGSVWTNRSNLYVGNGGANNQLVVA